MNPQKDEREPTRSELYKITGDQAKAEADMAKVLELMSESE